MKSPAKSIKREELYEAVWTKPIKTLAQEWNTTSLRIVQACEEMAVPRPGQGHWQWIARGVVIEREPLAERTGNIPDALVLLPQGARIEKGKAGRRREAAAVTGSEAASRRDATEAAKAPKEMPAAPGAPERQIVDLPRAAERAVLDMVRQAGEMDFWRDSISRSFGPGELACWFTLDREVAVAESKLRGVVGEVRREYRSFVVEVEDEKDEAGRARLDVEVRLRDGAEWKDAWEEAWTFAEHPNSHGLSDNALLLYEWAKGPKNTGAPRERRIIGLQTKLAKTNDLENLLREIRQRADPTIQWEAVTGGRCAKLRIWFERVAERFYDYGPINPTLALDIQRAGRLECGRLRDWLYEEIMRPGFPEGTEKVGVFDIRNRKVLKAAFGELPGDCGDYGPLPGFFDSVRLIDGLELRRTFNPGAGPWLVVCQAQAGTSWSQVKTSLTAKASAIPLAQRYSLSVDSRALLRWILDLRKEEYLLGMTPEVEDRLRGDIGIETDLGGGNARAYLELLVEEINEKTEFKLRTITWRHYARDGTRILVKRKGTRLDEIVRAVQGLALAENKVLDADKVRERILGLMHEN